MTSTSIPVFALHGDRIHDCGAATPEWSALALGSDGLATTIDRQAGQWLCRRTPDAKPTPLETWIQTFGQACPLLFVLPSTVNCSEADAAALAASLIAAPLRHPPRLVLPTALLPTLVAAGCANAFGLNPYGDPASEDHQAWGCAMAAARFPDYPPPSADLDNTLLLVRQARSGQFVPEAWLITDFGAVESQPPQALLLADSFRDGLASPHWIMGYSNRNKESTLGFGPPEAPALIVDMPAGTLYSGGGAVLALPIVDAFDARVRFTASHVAQGSTLELAAITVAPPQQSAIDRDNPREDLYRNLVFDVHGAPPYVSSECDEDDGFRLGWNCAYTVTDFQYSASGGAASSNIYNQYGKDCGGPQQGEVSGELRLVRSHDGVWASYFRVAGEAAWRCSGSRFLPGMPPVAYLRVAAKHWPKHGAAAPPNRVSFSDFAVHVPAWRLR